MAMTTEEKNARRRERYAQKKESQLRTDAGRNALRNVERIDLGIRSDGFYSQTTGQGISGVDKFVSINFAANDTLTEETLCALYLDNDVAASIVDRVVLDALRGGYELTWSGSSDQERLELVQKVEARLKVTDNIKKARVYGRLWGGGVTMLGSDNGGDKPFETPRKDGDPVKFLRAVPSTQFKSRAWNADVGSPDFSTVISYDYHLPTFGGVGNTGTPTVGQVVVDSSFTLPFYGLLSTDDRFRELEGWGDSVLRRCYDALKQFQSAYESVLHTMQENSIPVYKVEGLLKMLASENAELLQARFALLNAGKSNYRAIVLGENEEFLRVHADVAQAAGVLGTAMQRVSGASGQPMTVLWGMSPAGMNATGQSDLEIWNQQVAKEQALDLGPRILEAYKTILADPESELGGEVPEDLAVEFPSLWTPSLQDQVNNYAQVAGADVGYTTAGVLKPEQVAIARSKQKNTLFPSIDTKPLDAALALDADDNVLSDPLSGEGAETAAEAPPVGSPEGLDTPDGSEPQKAALNGAQISGLVAIATTVADGTLPLETAKAIAAASFPLASDTLEAIFSPLPAGKFEEEQNKPDPVNPLLGIGAPDEETPLPGDPKKVAPPEEEPAPKVPFGE